MKRILSLIVAIIMIAAMAPVNALAEESSLSIEHESALDSENVRNEPTRTQSHYQNFSTNYTLTGNGATDMVAVALAQEGKTGSQLGYTEEWCADFVGDCAILAGQSSAVPLYGAVSGLKEKVIKAGGTYTTSSPAVGDLCFIDWNQGGGYGHVEIVYAVSGTTVHTIGGNSGSGSTLYTRYVNKHSPLGSGYITCIVRPNYNNNQPITITFDANGGYCSTGSKTVNRGEAIGELPTATRDGYDFVGWFSTTMGNHEVFVPSDTLSSDITLYAHWANRLYQGNQIVFDHFNSYIDDTYSTHDISGFNTYRDVDMLVVFNCGGQTIDTNSYGAEIVIDSSGKVIQRRDYGDLNQLTVPEGGFILSGHGEGREVVESIDIGDFVSYVEGENKVYHYTSQEAYLKNTKFVEDDGLYGDLPEPHRMGYYFKGWYTYTADSYAVNYLTPYATEYLTEEWDQTPIPAASMTFNGHTYELYDYHMSWEAAKAFCEAKGGHLVTITSADEQALAIQLMQSGLYCTYHIGCSDAAEEGVWQWVTGEAFSYDMWDQDANEPNGGEDENYGQILAVNYGANKQIGDWNDADSNPYGLYGYMNGGFICEYEEICDHEYSYTLGTAPTQTQSGTIIGTCSLCGNTVSIELPVLNATDYTLVIVPATCISFEQYEYTWNETAYGDYVFLITPPEGYSEWSEYYPEGIDESRIESRTEYRYRDYETTTSYSTSMNGWDPVSSTWEPSGSGTIDYITPSWPSGFSHSHPLYTTYNNTPLSDSETETEKTVIDSTSTLGYIYWHWCRGTYTDGPINRQVRTEYSSEYCAFHAFFSTTDPSTLSTTPDSSSYTLYQYANANCCTDSYWFYCGITVKRQSYTNYRKLFTYGHWTDWSEWSPEPVTASDTREVETRTVYRYITSGYGDHVWDDGVVTVPATLDTEGEMTYTCTLCGATRTEVIPVLDHFTVTFKDWNGTVLKTENVAPGGSATAPADPEREGYDFTGWDRDFSNVTEDLIVTATYTMKTYTATFVDWDGTVLLEQTVPYGGTATPPSDPEREGYTFTGWDGILHDIMWDITYTAQYTVNTYTVTYYLDGELYTTEQVEYSAAIPTPAVETDGYTFSGWMLSDGSAVPASMPAHDLSVYGMLTRNYVTVTYTGAYNGTAEVPYGGNAELPVLEAEGIHYTFTVGGEAWDGTNLTEDVTVEVGMDINVYTVQFIDPIDNAVLDTQQITHGQNASAPAAPEHYGYTFTGWDKAFTNVKSDLTVNAVYTPVSYTVIFMDGCDNVIEIQSVPYGTAATAPEVPEREGWTFAGWDTDISCIEHDLVVNATWSRNYYTVTFTGVYTGTVIVEHGCDCELPVYNSNSIHYTFTVNGEPWDGKNITSDVTVTVGVAVNGTYTVTFVDWDGTVLDTQTVSYGNAATAPADPVRPGYTFAGWDVDFSHITSDLTVTAQYISNGPAVTLLGDVDLDGEVTAADALLAMRHSMSITVVSGQGFVNGDMDGDGSITATDAILIMRAVMGK